jgi:hypothetical protein
MSECKHGHEPWYDDPICLDCVREDTRNAAFDMIARILDETAKNPKINEVTTVSDLLKGIAQEVRKLKTKLPPRGSDRDGRAENPGSLDDLTALCPHCGGKGRIDVSIASGTAYAESCTKCGNYIGGCIVGGDSPLSEVPKPKECPFCGGSTEYKKES